MEKSKKFVIITMQRTGSNMLAHLLNEHEDIACFGELMRITPDWMKEQGYKGALRMLEKVDQKYKDDKVRFANPNDFVESVYKVARKKKQIKGFKLHTDQHPEYMKRLIDDPEYSLVLLFRDNVLAKYSSFLIAQQTGQGNARKGEKIKKAQVDFDAKVFARQKERAEREIEMIKEQIQISGKSAFQLEYTELGRKNRLGELIEFLGADASSIPEPVTEKRNSSNILERFNNPSMVLEFLESIGKTEWADEK